MTLHAFTVLASLSLCAVVKSLHFDGGELLITAGLELVEELRAALGEPDPPRASVAHVDLIEDLKAP